MSAPVVHDGFRDVQRQQLVNHHEDGSDSDSHRPPTNLAVRDLTWTPDQPSSQELPCRPALTKLVWTSPSIAMASSTSPAIAGGGLMTSSTPLVPPCLTVTLASPPSPTTATTALVTPTHHRHLPLDLFHRSAAQVWSEQRFRPSFTTDFALSALKNSFSMSSLSQQRYHPQVSNGNSPNNNNNNIISGGNGGGAWNGAQTPPCLQTPDAASRVKWERPFNSLTRLKDRERGGTTRMLWRRSFGSSPLTSKEDVGAGGGGGCSGPGQTDWPALQANYAYLMDYDLIECCRSVVAGELSWDHGDFEQLPKNSAVSPVDALSTVANASDNQSMTCAVGCQTDAEVTTADLQFQLQVLREWLKRMEDRVPKLELKPKWNREILEQRIVEFKILQREIEGRSSELTAVGRRCSSRNRRIGRALENRYHRLLLRILEWTFHLETLSKKPAEFWNGRRAAAGSPESETELPPKVARLNRCGTEGEASAKETESPLIVIHPADQVDGEEEMRQSGTEGGGSSPMLPATAPLQRRNVGTFEFKHQDTDAENEDAHSSNEAVADERSPSRRSRTADSGSNHTVLEQSVDSHSADRQPWAFSPTAPTLHANGTYVAEANDDRSPSSCCAQNVRKKLSFDELSEDGEDSASKSWYQYTSDDSDWLQSAALDLEGSELEDFDQEAEIRRQEEADEQPEQQYEQQAQQQAQQQPSQPSDVRVYDKEKVQKFVSRAEQMVSGAGCETAAASSGNGNGRATKGKKSERSLHYSREELNSECDASSELTSGESEAEEKQDAVVAVGTTGSTTGSLQLLNRTFNPVAEAAVSPASEFTPVILRNRDKKKAQRPWSLSGVPAAADDAPQLPQWTSLSAASETALNHLPALTGLRSSGAGTAAKPLMRNASTQKDMMSPSLEVLAAVSAAGLSSSGSAGGSGGIRQRRRRHSARRRNMLAAQRRADGEVLATAGSDNNLTLQNRLSTASAASSSSSSSSQCSDCECDGGRNRNRVMKSSTLTHLAGDPLQGSSTELRRPPSSTAKDSCRSSCSPLLQREADMTVPSIPIHHQLSPFKPPSAISTPRSAPSDGEHNYIGLGHTDETSNSEQAWDNYLDQYASEPYSEDPPDAESARRLLEFGEDYRNDLDSLSDCPSSWSAAPPLRGHHHHHYHHYRPHPPKRSPLKRLKTLTDRSRNSEQTMHRILDSDSDVDDLVHVVITSNSQLSISFNTFSKLMLSPRWEPSQCAELLATCQTNVVCLQTILSQVSRSDVSMDRDLPSIHEFKPVEELIEKWHLLESSVEAFHREGQQQRELQQQIVSLKGKLQEMQNALIAIPDEDLEQSLNRVRLLHSQVDDHRKALLLVNVAVHKCLTWMQEENSTSSPSAPSVSITTLTNNALKEDVADLYQMMDQLASKISTKEAELEQTNVTWLTFQKQLSDLQMEIAAEQEKLINKDQQKSFGLSQSSSQETIEQVDASQSSHWLESSWNGHTLNSCSLQCDSGISSGSDGEFMSLTDREKRLQTLKQLARKMEAALAPGTAALTRINQSLDKTEEDLYLLHRHLSHHLPVTSTSMCRVTGSTSMGAPFPLKEISVQTDPLVPKRKAHQHQPQQLLVASTCPSSSPYWWRILRAALPFHLVLLILMYMACIMEPSCCNYLNNFGNSLVPKLHYDMGGPPPI